MGSATPPSRCLGELTFPDVRARLRETSILCLPMGAMEQHGRHLPLNTDAVIAEELARRIIARWGDDSISGSSRRFSSAFRPSTIGRPGRYRSACRTLSHC
jgi:hypothetical protein